MLLRVTKEGSGGRRQAGTAYLNLIWLWPARLTLRMDLLSQFDIYHPAPNSSYPNSMWGVLQQLNYLAKGNIYTQLFTIACKWKRERKGNFGNYFMMMAKNRGMGKSVTPSAAVWLRQNQQKACFRSISPVFVHFNFSINCPLCKEVGCSRVKSAGNLHRRAIESSADCQFSTPLQNALQTPSNKYTDINHSTITKGWQVHLCLDNPSSQISTHFVLKQPIWA